MTTAKKLFYNSITGLFLQLTTVVCGIIVPRLIIGHFGSEINGIVTSITRFLSIISFMEMGVGYVIQAALYKPIADGDINKQSEIVVAGGKYFNKIAKALLVYILFLIVVFPYINESDFSPLFSATLIVAISISSLAQYMFGIVDRLFLMAHQRGYVQYIASIITLILNTIACIILIHLNASIQMVKLVSSFIFVARPVLLRIYINKHYSINRKMKVQGNPLPNKMSGLAMHISSVVLEDTDTIVLTVLSSYSNVSIYSVYHLIVYGVKQILFSVTSGFDSILGQLWAKQELEKLRTFFSTIEWLIHTATTLIFSCTAVLILPFVSVYTNGITDAEYIQPLFAMIITIATAGHCLRLPYNKMIVAGGHFKQTQVCYIGAAVMNLVVSCATVYMWGLVGVALGTLVAMFFQTIWMAFYDSKHFLCIPFRVFLKQMTVDVVTFILIYFSTSFIHLKSVNYFSWIILAAEVFIIATVEVVLINVFIYKGKIREAAIYLKNKKGRRKS